MTYSVELEPAVEKALVAKAQRRGLNVESFLRELAVQAAQAPDEKSFSPVAAKPSAASVRGKYAVPGAATVDDFMAERRAEGLAETLSCPQALDAKRY